MQQSKENAMRAEMDSLQKLDLPALQAKWRARYKIPAPLGMRTRFLRLMLGYQIREDAGYGLKPEKIRELKKLAEQLKTGEPIKAKEKLSLAPGVRLMREWLGQMEIVDVTESGFLWRGQEFRSLSNVATTMTGTKWSGPKFFGLLDKKSKLQKVI